MSATRIYLVAPRDAGVVDKDTARLVRATSQAQAMRHVAEDTLACEVAEVESVAELCAHGVRVEDAVPRQRAISK